ncbi:MAG: alpha-galactosidase [Clostridia bacterium]|nr:alpha-galactosidase [Clostridia bacterium]
MKLRMPDMIRIYGEDWSKDITCQNREEKSFCFDHKDVNVKLEIKDEIKVYVKAETTPLTYLRLRFNFTETEKRKENIKIMGDAFERGYGELEWFGIKPERMFPWYILVSNGTDSDLNYKGRFTEGFGIKTLPNSFAAWQYDAAGITLWIDIRNGGKGVHLNGRELLACEVVFGEFYDMSAFFAGKEFCKMMCASPVLPKHKVYGSNNWYYAYGKSSHEEILSDTKLVAEACSGLENIPYMVIDDGWQKNKTDAPWDKLNERFHDMKELASEMSKMGVRPGIWVRYLVDSKFEVKEKDSQWRYKHDSRYFDPSHPEVIEYVKRITKMFVDWGYKLIKHDFTAGDIFGPPMSNERVTKNNWCFYDKTKTSAEITYNLYKAIKDAAGDDCIIIGCNSISHLCAGIYELNRTGMDTSGERFEYTRQMGVNTLAFRLMQNGTFYMADADCVGIMGPIPWKLNREWLKALAYSGSPLFISCKPGILNDEEFNELKEAYKVNSIQENELFPLDWMENLCPERWMLDGKEIRFNWYDNNGPEYFNPFEN